MYIYLDKNTTSMYYNHMRKTKLTLEDRIMDNLGCLMIIFLGIIPALSWLTHIITCFQDDRWGFLIAGAVFFPIAMVHGIGIWFGLW
jgi:hypothetical protein